MATRMKTGPSKSGSGRTSRRPSITSSTSGLNAPKAEAVLEEEPVQHIEGGVVLTIKILSARNIRGAKGEKVNSFVRVQFADFDYKDVSMDLEILVKTSVHSCVHVCSLRFSRIVLIRSTTSILSNPFILMRYVF